MAVTRQGRSLTMTADADAVAVGNVFAIAGANFKGTGLTAGQQLKLTDAGGSIIFDYQTADTSDNADLINGRAAHVYNGLTLTGPAAGTWTLTLILE